MGSRGSRGWAASSSAEGYHSGGLCLTLGLHNLLPLFLLRFFYQELGPLGFLLSHLFGFYSCCVLPAEAQLSDGDIVQDEAEVLGPLRQLPSDQQGHLGPLGDQLGGVELGHHTLEHLVDNGGQHSLLIVQPQALVHAGQLHGVGSGQHPQGDVHHLQVFGACGGGNFSGSGSNIIDDRVLEPGDPGGEGTRIGIRRQQFPSFCSVLHHHLFLGLLLLNDHGHGDILFSLWRTTVCAAGVLGSTHCSGRWA
uniref:Prohibitin-2 n=1 Tax=Sus scrofa TaxID=9823 RepID=A0A480HAH8_PIG